MGHWMPGTVSGGGGGGDVTNITYSGAVLGVLLQLMERLRVH